MNEQTDEQTTMHREWMDLQVRRFQLDAERDRAWLEHITRQTRTMEMQTEALTRIALTLAVLVDLIVAKSAAS